MTQEEYPSVFDIQIYHLKTVNHTALMKQILPASLTEFFAWIL